MRKSPKRQPARAWLYQDDGPDADVLEPVTLDCIATTFGRESSHWYCDPMTCIEAAIDAAYFEDMVECTTCNGPCTL